jgi:hypothetical protein
VDETVKLLLLRKVASYVSIADKLEKFGIVFPRDVCCVDKRCEMAVYSLMIFKLFRIWCLNGLRRV